MTSSSKVAITFDNHYSGGRPGMPGYLMSTSIRCVDPVGDLLKRVERAEHLWKAERQANLRVDRTTGLARKFWHWRAQRLAKQLERAHDQALKCTLKLFSHTRPEFLKLEVWHASGRYELMENMSEIRMLTLNMRQSDRFTIQHAAAA